MGFNAADLGDGDDPWDNEALLKVMEALLGSARTWSKNLAGILGDQRTLRAMRASR